MKFGETTFLTTRCAYAHFVIVRKMTVETGAVRKQNNKQG
jgi:hypothetical protein